MTRKKAFDELESGLEFQAKLDVEQVTSVATPCNALSPWNGFSFKAIDTAEQGTNDD